MMKSQLRQHYKNLRQAFVKDQGDHDFALDFLTSFQKYVAPLITPGMCVALYHALPHEADPRCIAERLFDHGVQVAFPKMEGETIDFVHVEESTAFTTSAYIFQEPLSHTSMAPDIVLAPLLAFDKEGHRLGYGKGHYDRAISTLRSQKKVRVIGLAYPCEQTDTLPHEDHDQKLDAVLLPHAYIEFNTI